MSTRSSHPRAAAALTGFLVGGAAGFLLGEAVGAFFSFVLGRPLDVEGTGVLLAVFVATPVVCAALGAVAGLRRAGPGRHASHRDG